MRDLRRLTADEPSNICSIAAAVIGSAVIGAGAGIIGSKSAASTQSKAATEAAAYQLQAAREAAQLQLGMFNTIRGDLAPYRGVGTAALPGYYALLGLTPPGGGAPAASGGGGYPSISTATANGTGAAGGDLVIPGLNGGGATAGVNVPKVGDVNWGQILKDNPAILAEYQQEASRDSKSKQNLANLGISTPEDYAEWWYKNLAPQGYAPPTWTQEQITSTFPTAAGSNDNGGSGTGTGAGTGNPAAPALDSSGIQSYLENLPGYKFIRDQGIKSTTNALSSKGLGGISGPMAKGISRFVTGLADSTYGEQLTRIGNAVGVGQSAANQTGAYGQQATSGAAQSLIGGANAVAGGITGAANASAAGTIGAANSIAGAASSIPSAILTSRILANGGSNFPATTNI